MPELKSVSAEHLQAAVDAILGLDPSQAPSDPVALNERLSQPQKGLTETLVMFVHQANSKHFQRALPLVYVLTEAVTRAYPEEMKEEIRSKAFAMSIATSAQEAKAAIEGAKDGAVRTRQPALVDFVDRQLLAEEGFAAKLAADERTGLYALCLGTIRVLDRQISGAEKPVVAEKLPGRNDPCHCGSGKKFKKCHGA